MTKASLPLAALAIGLLSFGLAHAAPLPGAEIGARLPGSELRGEFVNGGRFESHVWRFAPDGSVYAAYFRYPHGNIRSVGEDRREIGRWGVEGNLLCVQFPALFAGFRNCFAIDASPSIYVRVIGSPTFVGTLTSIH